MICIGLHQRCSELWVPPPLLRFIAFGSKFKIEISSLSPTLSNPTLKAFCFCTMHSSNCVGKKDYLKLQKIKIFDELCSFIYGAAAFCTDLQKWDKFCSVCSKYWKTSNFIWIPFSPLPNFWLWLKLFFLLFLNRCWAFWPWTCTCITVSPVFCQYFLYFLYLPSVF